MSSRDEVREIVHYDFVPFTLTNPACRIGNEPDPSMATLTFLIHWILTAVAPVNRLLVLVPGFSACLGSSTCGSDDNSRYTATAVWPSHCENDEGFAETRDTGILRILKASVTAGTPVPASRGDRTHVDTIQTCSMMLRSNWVGNLAFTPGRSALL